MVAQSGSYWMVLALVAVMYVVMCARVAARMTKIGRSGVKWFLISLFCTAIPAAIVLKRYVREARAAALGDDRPTGRCRHCGAVLGTVAPGAPSTCPECGMALNEETLA